MTTLENRTERLLALLLIQQVKSSPQKEKVRLLSLAGYSNLEIADLLETTSAVVSTILYQARKAGTKKKGAKKKKSGTS